MFKKGNNIFSLLIIILSVFMTSSVNIINAADSSTPETTAVTNQTNSDQNTDATQTTVKDWGSQLITKVQLQNADGKTQDTFDPYDTIKAYWEFATPKGGVNEDDTITVTVPKELVITGDVTKPQTVTEIPGGHPIGTATLNKEKRTVTITFNSYAANKSKSDTVTGSFYVSTSWNLNLVQEHQNVPIDWNVNATATNNTGSTGSASVGQASVTDPNEILYKYGSYIENGDIIQWTVRVNYKGETINDAVYRDTLGKNQTLLNDADHPITVNSATADHDTGKITNDTDNKFANIKATPTDDGFDVNLGTIDQTAIITYYTKIDNLAEKSTSYSNTGDLLSNKNELQNITINQPNTTLGSDAHDGDQVTSIMGHKIWSVPAGTKLPDSITINLIQNGNSATPYASKTVTADTNWSYVFNNLPKYDNEGNAYNYTVQETPVTGFTSIPDPTNYNITNVLSNMKVTKVWNDGESKNRPSSVRVGVYDGSGKMAPGTDYFDLSGENGWTHTFENLPADTYWYVSEVGYNGETNYTVPEDYISTQTTNNGNNYDKTITNTLATTLTVNKVWDDGDNQNVTNHDSVQIQLYQNDNNRGKQSLGDPVTLNSGNNWTYKFGVNDQYNTESKTTQLPKYDADGNEITYSAEEVTVPDGYTMSSDFDPTDKTKETITNTYESPTTPTDDTRDFTVNKVWDDNDSPKRPSSITVYLTANDKRTGDPVTIKPDTNGEWTYTWTGLAKNDADGKAIKYSADENDVDDYTKKVDVAKDDASATITNTANTTTDDNQTNFKVSKVWDDNNSASRPSSVQVQLEADGDSTGSPVTLSEDNNWTYDWDKLDKTDNDKDIKYTVSEVNAPKGYTPIISYPNSTSATITNTLDKTPGGNTGSTTTSLNVTKTWSDSNNKDNLRPSQVTINLLKDGKKVDSAVLNAGNKWAHNFTGLDKTSIYTVSEDAVFDYTSNIDDEGANGVKITNTHTPSTTTTTDDKTNLTVNKLWNDSNNKDNLRPSQVTVHLLKNGSVIGQAVQLSSLNAWSYTWNNLDKNGNYSVQEDAVSGYTAAQSTNSNVITITNTHTPKTPGNPDNPGNPFTPDNPGGNNGNNGGNGGTGDQVNTGNGGGGSNTTTDFTPNNPMVPSVPYQKTNTSNGLLPQTGSKDANILYSILGVLILGFISMFELKRKRA